MMVEPQPGVMQLLWRGIAAYVFQNKIELMLDAQLPGTDPMPWRRVDVSVLYHSRARAPTARPAPSVREIVVWIETRSTRALP